MLLTLKIGKKTLTAMSLKGLRKKFEAWRDDNDYGASDIGGKWPIRGHPTVTDISYNGRFWAGGVPAVEQYGRDYYPFSR